MKRQKTCRPLPAATRTASRGTIQCHSGRSMSRPPVTADPLQVAKTDSPPPSSIASAPSATPLAVSPDAAETEMLGQAAAGRRGAEVASPSAGVPMAADNSGRLSDLPSDEAIRSDESLAARPASPTPGPAPANRAEESTIAAASPPPLMPESRSIELRANGKSKLATTSAGQSAPAKAMPPSAFDFGRRRWRGA